MTKVEELRDKIHARVPYMDIDVTLLISAAHAEGVAEGAEETLAKIREVARPLLVSHGGALEVVSIPASVLAPTKEKP